MKKKAHIISHTHWDREWYLPYETHHMMLVENMDKLLDAFEKNSGFNYFHLDGQTVLLEDYLEVRPERKEVLKQAIQLGKLNIGPWFVLQDEFLTSSEANIRNLYYGFKDCHKWGVEATKIGYFPDSFGNMGQAPQILKQAGIETAAFGRGVKPTGFNNEVSDMAEFESPYSEMYWEGRDGSTVLGILFANWYNNGMEVPTSDVEAKKYWEKRISDAEKFASTSELLFMNGCDHQPPQVDLGEAITVANRLYSDIEFVHSNFNEYVHQIKSKLPENLQVIKGELRSQQTDGWYTLVNTASARVYLKQWNQLCQTLFEKVAEPIATMAKRVGYEYPHHLFEYGWKSLMKNHPHDSICGCSVDSVHREMVARFEKAHDVAKFIIDEASNYITSKISIKAFEGNSVATFAVINSSGYAKREVATISIDVLRVPFTEGHPTKIARDVREIKLDDYAIIDSKGTLYPAKITDAGIRFGYDLPKDKFRQPFYARVVNVEFETPLLDSFSVNVFALVKEKKIFSNSLLNGNILENDYIKAEVNQNGSINVTDKLSGVEFKSLGILENSGDVGNEYIFKAPKGETPLTSENLIAEMAVIEDTPYKVTIQATLKFEVPKEMATKLFEHEKEEVLEFKFRESKRSDESVVLEIALSYTLEKHSKGVKVCVEYNNSAKDCRMRMLFPTGIASQNHLADSIFEVASRSNFTEKVWENPSNCQHQHAFVNVSCPEFGLTVANKGLNEYEILSPEKCIIAVTLLRSVSELGDWGVFETPEAQCLGSYKSELEIIPHGMDKMESFRKSHNFQIPLTLKQIFQSDSTLEEGSFLTWCGENIFHSTLKTALNGDSIIRFYNAEDSETKLNITTHLGTHLYLSNILEQTSKKAALPLKLNKAEIVTLAIRED